MLRLNLSNTPDWLDLGHSVRVFVEPMSTAVMIAARRDPQIAALGDSMETLTNDDLALVMAKAVARIAIKAGKASEMLMTIPSSSRPPALTPCLRSGRSLKRSKPNTSIPDFYWSRKKNVSAPLPTGNSAGAQPTAKPARGRARTARKP